MFDMHRRIGGIRYIVVYCTVFAFLLMVAAGVGCMIVPGNSVMTLGIFLFIPIAGIFKVVQRRLVSVFSLTSLPPDPSAP